MNHQSTGASPREQLEAKYMASRANLLLFLIITAVDIVLVMVRSGMNLLYSFAATVPVYIAGVGMEQGNLGTGIGLGLVGLALVGPYVVCFILSKKNYRWLLGALAYFILDCAFLAILSLKTGVMPDVIELIMHVYILYYLLIGVIRGGQLRRMVDADEATDIPANAEEAPDEPEN